MDRLFPGDVSERPKEHAWKACVVQATAGSNPAVTATDREDLRIAEVFSRFEPRQRSKRTPYVRPPGADESTVMPSRS